jgi:hypothetical protein
MSGRLFAAATLLLVLGCASPREKAYKNALKDYQRANKATIEYARAQAKQLASAARTFYTSLNRWPKTFNELASFAIQNRLAFDPYAFNDVTFAELSDGSVQIHYDVNCARFDTPQYKFSQSGSINVKAKVER